MEVKGQQKGTRWKILAASTFWISFCASAEGSLKARKKSASTKPLQRTQEAQNLQPKSVGWRISRREAPAANG